MYVHMHHEKKVDHKYKYLMYASFTVVEDYLGKIPQSS